MMSSTQNRYRFKRKVIVIGAGPSGIGAARVLKDNGFVPIVLEARDRIGGRVAGKRLYSNLVEGQINENEDNYVSIQLGANWIHGLDDQVNPFFVQAKRLQFELFQSSSDDEPGEDVILFDVAEETETTNTASGQTDKLGKPMIRVSPEDYHSVLRRYEWIKANFDELFRLFVDEDYFSFSLCKVSLKEAFESAILASEATSLGPCSTFHRRCLNWLLDRVAIDMASPLSNVSVQNYMEGDSSGMYGEATIVNEGGIPAILKHIAFDRDPIDIHYNTIVQQIEILEVDTPNDIVAEEVDESDSDDEKSTFYDSFTVNEGHHNLEDFTIGSLGTRVLTLHHPPSASQSNGSSSTSTHKQRKVVRVVCDNDEVFEADFVVLTVPISLLSSSSPNENISNKGKINFSPSIPPAIDRLTSTLKMGLMNLVWFWFPHQFWPTGYNFFGVAREESTEETTFTTFFAPKILDKNSLPQPVLMAQVVGLFAERCELISERDLATMAVQMLRRMFGEESVPDAIGCARSTWRSDPFSRGSWSYFPYDPSTYKGEEDDLNQAQDALTHVEEANVAVQQIGEEDADTSSSSSSASSSRSSSSDSYGGSSSVSFSLSSLQTPLSSLPPALAESSSSSLPTAPNLTSSDRYHQKQQQQNDDVWEGRLLYAGEATSVQFRGSAHGAFISGCAAAESIINRIQREEEQERK